MRLTGLLSGNGRTGLLFAQPICVASKSWT